MSMLIAWQVLKQSHHKQDKVSQKAYVLIAPRFDGEEPTASAYPGTPGDSFHKIRGIPSRPVWKANFRQGQHLE